MMTSIPRRLPRGPRASAGWPCNQAHPHHRANSIAHREDGKSAKRTDKNKAKEKIEQIAGQVVDATVELRRASGPGLLETTY
jgi:hypothetical protein